MGLAAPIEAWAAARAERATKVLVDASNIVEAAGATARPVPGRVLWPLLSNASLEEDDELRRRWAVLLANASTSKQVVPSYVEILRQLTPLHVRTLDYLYKDFLERATPDGSPRNGHRGASPFTIHCGLDAVLDFDRLDDYYVLASDLERLNLIHTSELVELEQIKGGHLARIPQPFHTDVALTFLGIFFLKACCIPPSSSGDL